MTRTLKPLTALMSAAWLLGACSGVPLTSYPKLTRLDPMTANPTDILLATRLHESVQTDNLRVSLDLTFEDEEAGLSEAHQFEAEVSPAQFLTPVLAKGAGLEDRTTLMQLKPADAESLKGFQQRVREHREAGGEGEGALTISVTGFCVPSKEAIEDKELTLFMKTDPESDFFVFLNRDLDDLLSEDDLDQVIDGNCGENAGLQ